MSENETKPMTQEECREMVREQFRLVLSVLSPEMRALLIGDAARHGLLSVLAAEPKPGGPGHE